MSAKNHIVNPRIYMEPAVETMQKSMNESRIDKSSPLVSAVLVFPDGRVETACRGELSDGDHAEYTLLERKLSTENLSGATLFAILEPCAPGARSETKTSCAERIVNRRISKVWIGIEYPDPQVDGKRFRYRMDNRISSLSRMFIAKLSIRWGGAIEPFQFACLVPSPYWLLLFLAFAQPHLKPLHYIVVVIGAISSKFPPHI